MSIPYVVLLPLFTKDGRVIGNATIIEVFPSMVVGDRREDCYRIETERGNKATLTRTELERLFYTRKDFGNAPDTVPTMA